MYIGHIPSTSLPTLRNVYSTLTQQLTINCLFSDLFNNVVTFRIADSSINLPTFDMGHSGDIYLEFKTTVQNAVIFHSKGPTDFIKLAIVGMLLDYLCLQIPSNQPVLNTNVIHLFVS